MRMLRKIAGGILILTGVVAVFSGILGIATEIYGLVSGDEHVFLGEFLIFLCMLVTGAGSVYGGVVLCKKKDSRVESGKEDIGKRQGEQGKRRHIEQQGEQQREQQREQGEGRYIKQDLETQPVLSSAWQERFTMLVEDRFPIRTEGCVVTGILKGGDIHLRHKIWVLKPDGTGQLATVDGLEVIYSDGAVKGVSAENDDRIGIFMSGIDDKVICIGSIVTNITPNIDDVNMPIENPMLKGLLAGRYQTWISDIQERIQKEILEHAKFLVIVAFDILPEDNGDGTATFQKKSTMKFPFLTSQEGEEYQPVYTDWTELQGWGTGDEPKPNTITMRVQDVFSLLESNPEMKGMVVNPFSDNLRVDREQFQVQIR